MNIEKRKVYIANLSGGKDSLFMLKIILSNPQKYAPMIIKEQEND